MYCQSKTRACCSTAASLIPEPTEETEIEGETCIVALCALSDEQDEAGAYPVLIKKSCIQYPPEFLGRVKSALIFHGELMPAPLSVMGKNYGAILMARAIAHLSSNEGGKPSP